MYRVRAATGINKKSITNNRTKEKHTAKTNTKFYANTMANGMTGEKLIA